MDLKPGNTIVHPHHGPATVISTEMRTLRGKEMEYVNLEITDGKLHVSVPAASIEEIGLRELADKEDLAKLAEVLAGPSGQQETQWSRRIKAQREEVSSGDPIRLAGVVRDLVRRNVENPLGTAEKDLLRQAISPLVAEVAIAVGRTEDEADAVIRQIVLDESTDVLDKAPEEREKSKKD